MKLVRVGSIRTTNKVRYMFCVSSATIDERWNVRSRQYTKNCLVKLPTMCARCLGCDCQVTRCAPRRPSSPNNIKKSHREYTCSQRDEFRERDDCRHSTIASQCTSDKYSTSVPLIVNRPSEGRMGERTVEERRWAAGGRRCGIFTFIQLHSFPFL